MFIKNVAFAMQLEVELESLAQLETLWSQIPPQAHKAWSQRAQVGAFICSQPIITITLILLYLQA